MESEKKYAPIDNPFDPWCPLFGPLPGMEYNPGSTVNRCAEVIINSRRTWDAYQDGTWFHSCPRYCENIRDEVFRPVPNDLPDYDIRACLSANTILQRWTSLTQQHSHPGSDPRTFERDKCISNRLEYFVWNMAVEEVRYISWGYVWDTIPDSAILAVFALSEAWHVLESVLAWGTPENDEGILQDVRMAEKLLSVARSITKHEEDHVRQSRRGHRKGASTRELLVTSARAIIKDKHKAVSSYNELAKQVVLNVFPNLLYIQNPDDRRIFKKIDSVRKTIKKALPGLF